MTVELQISTLEDPQILLEVNNSALPDVNQLDYQKACWLVAQSLLARVATLDGRVAGVIVVLGETAVLNSEYFKWFTFRYENFIYIDRVIVAAWARRLGVATTLYLAVEQVAKREGLAIASEVYCDPPNIASLRFHENMRYREVAQQSSSTEAKTVSKLLKYAENARRKKPPP